MRAGTLLSWVALWALGFVRASVQACTGGCGSWSSLKFSKHNNEDQDDGRIMKEAREQHYILLPAPIYFLNNELKAELRMKSKKEK
jgi:hypothetical protein